METSKAIHDYLKALTPHVLREKCPFCIQGLTVRAGQLTQEKCAVCAGYGTIAVEAPTKDAK